MLRAVLVGVLSMSAVGCKSSSEAPRVQPGVAAGKVVEVSGTVTLRQGDVARPLGKGDTVEGDDVVETGADGSVVIELAHNLARWELGAGRKAKVRESTAWGLARKSGDVVNVEQNSAAAGRHAERSAAETGVSASAEAAPAAAAATEEAAEIPAPAPPARGAAAPARPPAATPPRKNLSPAEAADHKELGGGLTGKELPRGTGVGTFGTPEGAPSGRNRAATSDAAAPDTARLEAAPSPAIADRAAHEVVLRNRKAIQACLTKEMPTVELRIEVGADGKATVLVHSKTDVPDAVKTCVTSAVEKLSFRLVPAKVSIEIAK